jgi:general secretion pathway protein K
LRAQLRKAFRAGSFRAATVRERVPEHLQPGANALHAVARRGGALLAVLWLSAALAAIAFSAAQTVRAERDRTANLVDGTRAALLASSGVERGLLYVQWGPGIPLPDGRPRFWAPGLPFLRFSFPSGEALVEIIPESSKMNVNSAPPDFLARLIVALGYPPPLAAKVAAAIVDWRSRYDPQTALDPLYLRLNPTFRVPHASFQQIEELSSVYGMTSELLYGRVERTPDGNWVPRAGLRDCLSVYGAGGSFDINSVQPAVMAAAGVPPDAISTVVALRRHAPIMPEQLRAFAANLGPAAASFIIGGDKFYTIRATARIRKPNGGLSDLRRTATLTVLLSPTYDPGGYRILDARSGPAVRPLEETWPW